MDVILFITQWLTFILLIFLAILLLYLLRRYNYWKHRNVPYVTPYPLIGNLQFVLRKSLYEFMDEIGEKYRTNDYVGIYLGLTPALVVQSPDLARLILARDYGYFQNRYIYASKESDPLGSLNLFTVKNPLWTKMRHALAPMFTSHRLRLITELMNINSEQLVYKIDRDYIRNKQTVDVKELFAMYTSDTVAFTVFGLRVSALSTGDSPLWQITKHMVNFDLWRGLEFILVFLLPGLAAKLRLQLFSKSATDYIKKIFWDVVDHRNQNDMTNEKDFLNLLLKVKENVNLPANGDPMLADNLMMAQAAVFILGAIETSSFTLSALFHELAHHPEEQEKIYNEISEAVKANGKDILQYDDLMQLKYLSSCIYETLRKYPPVPYLDRCSSNDYKLGQSITIEAGTPVFINVTKIHHDERLWPEPMKWNPDREGATSDNDNVNYSFLPFGDGPRFCIGKRYALMQIRAVVVQILMRYRVEPGTMPYALQYNPYAIISSPKHGNLVQFIAR